MYEYRAEAVRVIDGDTVVVHVDLGFSVWQRNQVVRLARIDAPEMRTEAGVRARAALHHLLFGVEPLLVNLLLPVAITLRTYKDKREKYGRYLAEIHLNDGRNVNDLMLAGGYARQAPWKPVLPAEHQEAPDA